MAKGKSMSAKKVLLLDTGHEWGGGTVSMIELVQKIDRSRIQITCCIYNNYRHGRGGETLSSYLKKIQISTIIVPIFFESFWIKITKEFVRVFFFFNKTFRKFILQKIDMQSRIKNRVSQIVDIMSADSYDLIYLNNQPSSNLEGYLAAHLLNIPVVQHSRIDILLSKFEISMVNKIANSVICNSYGLRKSLLKQGVNSKKLSVVYNGFEMPKLRNKANFFKKSSTQITLGTVSSLIKRKFIHHIIDAFEICRFKHNLNVHLIIVGEGPEYQNLIRYAKNKNVMDYVTFVGFSKDPISWIRQMDLFVFASNREGFGRVIVEAMLSRKPVVAANSIGPNEIIIHGKTGYLYTHGNIKDMVSYIIKLVKDKKCRNSMGEAALLSAKKRFTITKYIDSVSKILEKAAS